MKFQFRVNLFKYFCQLTTQGSTFLCRNMAIMDIYTSLEAKNFNFEKKTYKKDFLYKMTLFKNIQILIFSYFYQNKSC